MGLFDLLRKSGAFDGAEKSNTIPLSKPLSKSVPTGQRDFDYVAFGDYAHDMEELRTQSVAAIGLMRERAQRAELMLGLAAIHAGGELRLSQYDLVKLRPGEPMIEFEQYFDPATGEIVMSAKWKLRDE